MELKKGEKIVKKGGVAHDFWGGTLYLTNKRLFLEYYQFGIFSKETKIQLNEITDVYKPKWVLRPYHCVVKVEYKHNENPQNISFFSTDSPIGTDMMRIADEWVVQIRRMAKLDPKEEIVK